MRNISFSLTTDQIRDRSKTVTRRKGWQQLRPGELLSACVKCMGLRRGERIERLATIRVVSVTFEQLRNIDADDVHREGFPGMDPVEFIQMFCREMKVQPTTYITRIEFEYVDTQP